MAELPPPPGHLALRAARRIPESRCPQCRARCTAVTQAFGADQVPSPENALSLCMECGALLEFGADWAPRVVTAQGEAALPKETREQTEWLRNALAEFWRQEGKPRA